MNNKGMRDYDPTSEEVHISQLIRVHPTLDKAPSYVRNTIDKYANNYVSFLNKVQITPDCVKEAVSMFEESQNKSKHDFYLANDEKTAFSMVRFGQKPTSEGVRILYSHCDSPCLQAKVKPLLFEWDIDMRDLHLGVEIDGFAYGGVHPHQWTGRDLLVKGWGYINKRRKEFVFPVYSAEVSQHTDTRAQDDTSFRESHKEESLDLIPGDISRKAFIKRLGLTSELDFARCRLYAVPINKARRLHKYYITGYGQDDRIGVYTAVKGLLESKPKYTTIVMGFDKEEVGSADLSGASGMFFEQTLDEIMFREEKKTLDRISDAYYRYIYRQSIAINADVDVGSTDKEIINVDQRNVGKLGFGVFVSGYDGMFESDQLSPKLVDHIMCAIDKNGGNKIKTQKIVLQTVGSVLSPDNGSVQSMNEFFVRRGIPTINCGVAVGSLHSPTEVSHVGDLYHTIRAYKAIIENS